MQTLHLPFYEREQSQQMQFSFSPDYFTDETFKTNIITQPITALLFEGEPKINIDPVSHVAMQQILAFHHLLELIKVQSEIEYTSEYDSYLRITFTDDTILETKPQFFTYEIDLLDKVITVPDEANEDEEVNLSTHVTMVANEDYDDEVEYHIHIDTIKSIQLVKL